MKKADKSAYKAACHSIREDGAWIDAGENDNLIVQKLEANANAFGVFGFSFLDQNSDKLQGSMVDGVEPTFEKISAQDYPVSRSLYFYVKNAHANSIPGMQEYIGEFTSEGAWGPDGYLGGQGPDPLAGRRARGDPRVVDEAVAAVHVGSSRLSSPAGGLARPARRRATRSKNHRAAASGSTEAGGCGTIRSWLRRVVVTRPIWG